MSSPSVAVGEPFAEIDTPALLLDAAALRANIGRMASYFAGRKCRLRPHFKSHKCTRIARLQMEAGATGITCAKLGEAEVLADSGIRNLLIANQIVGPLKLARLVALARRADPIVAVDSEENLRMISRFAAAANVSIGIFIEVDIGMHRCGVQPGEPALKLARLAGSLPGVTFRGLQGYEGHVVDLRDLAERTAKTQAAMEHLVSTRRVIENAGIPVELASGGGTGTYTITGNIEGVDEVQAGSYAAMDWWYRDIRPEFAQAMSVLVTVISRPSPTLAVIDVGRKGVGAEMGPPRVKTMAGAEIANFGSEEHAVIRLPENDSPKVGDKIEIIPSHGCTTSNLYREFVLYENGVATERWPIEGSGKLQ